MSLGNGYLAEELALSKFLINLEAEKECNYTYYCSSYNACFLAEE